MHSEVINQKTKRLLASLGRQSVLRKFYLAGGTGLALQFGHRQSIDLDFFSPTGFRPNLLKQKLAHIGRLTVEMEEKGTLNLSLAGVAISFLQTVRKLSSRPAQVRLNFCEAKTLADLGGEGSLRVFSC